MRDGMSLPISSVAGADNLTLELVEDILPSRSMIHGDVVDRIAAGRWARPERCAGERSLNKVHTAERFCEGAAEYCACSAHRICRERNELGMSPGRARRVTAQAGQFDKLLMSNDWAGRGNPPQ